MQFDLELFIKAIGVIVAVASIWKIFKDVTTSKASRLREEYKFAKEFLEDLKRNPPLDPFTVEIGYQAIAGNTSIRSEEIAYLLTLKNPAQCLKDYLLTRNYFSRLDLDGDLKLEFSKKYASSSYRNFVKRCNAIGYFICVISALAPAFFSDNYYLSILITLPSFGYAAYFFLNNYARICRAERLFNNQQKYKSNIALLSDRPNIN